MRYYNFSMTFATELEGKKWEAILKELRNADYDIFKKYNKCGVYCVFNVGVGEIKEYE